MAVVGVECGTTKTISLKAACLVDRLGAHLIRFGKLPLAIRGLVQKVQTIESLTPDRSK